MLPRGGAAVIRRVPGQPEHLGADAIEQPRVPLLVAPLEEEDPRHQALLGQQLPVARNVGERGELLRHRVLGHAEAGQDRGQPLAPLIRELGPRARVAAEVDGLRTPLQSGHDPREEIGPEAPLREDEMAGDHALP